MRPRGVVESNGMTGWLGGVITTPLDPELAGSFRGVLWCEYRRIKFG